MRTFNRAGIFWPNVASSEQLNILPLSASLDCHVVMPEALDRVPEIRVLRPNAYIQVRHSTPNWPQQSPEAWAQEVKRVYDSKKGLSDEFRFKHNLSAFAPRTIGEMVDGWSFLNEPDIEPSFPGWGQPIKDQVQAAARWATECAHALKKLIPGIRLHAPAMAFEDRGYGWEWFIETMKPLYTLCSVINSHNYWEHGGVYNAKALYDDPNDPNGLSYHHAFRYRQLRVWLLEFGISGPIFIEEFGSFNPSNPRLWEEYTYFVNQLTLDAAFVIGGCLFILKSNAANWVNDLTRQSNIKEFFQNIGAQNFSTLPYPEAEDIRPKIKIAVRASHLVPFSPIVSHKEIPIEEYVRDVVGWEMPSYIKALDLYPNLEAFKAQAVAARTYAANAMRFPRHGSDHVCNSTHCQVWAPGRRTEVSERAVKETEGATIRYKGEPIGAFYSANCGGSTINSEDIWPQALPYCRAVPCPVGGTVSGHRVGLCQYGLVEMTSDGKSAAEVLKYYYTGVTVDLPVPPAPPPSPPEDSLMVAETRTGPPVIVGDLKVAGQEVVAEFWDNKVTVVSGHKPEYGVGGFELRGWPAVDTAIRVVTQSKTSLIPVSKARPWTRIELRSAEPIPPPPQPEPEPAPYPGPYPDTGLFKPPSPFGIHGGLDMREAALAEDLVRVAELGVGTILIVPGDEMQLERAATFFWRSGILPVVRPYCLIDRVQPERFVKGTRILLKHDIPPFMVLMNEPSDTREYANGRPNETLFVQKWVNCAKAVVDAGGWPGLQVLDVSTLRRVIAETRRQGAVHIWERAWFCPHNYGLNHPPNYPYDDVNQLGVPVMQVATERFVAPAEQVNEWREKDKNPGQTIDDDYNCVLGFLPFALVFESELGFVPPMICGEGGWQYGSSQDRRYPVAEGRLHADYHAEMFSWFRTKVLSNGTPLPPYLWAVCPWILSGYEADAWFGGPLGTKEETIRKVREVTLG